MEENKYPALLNHALKFGLIIGFSQIAITLILYIADKSLLVSFSALLIVFVINIMLMVLPVKVYKKQKGGIISFQDAFMVCFIAIAGGALLSVVFNYFLYNVIDPGLADYIKTQTIEKTVALLEKFGTSAEEIDKAIQPLTEQNYQMTPAKLAGVYFQTVLFGGIPALIIAAIMKTKKKSLEEL